MNEREREILESALSRNFMPYFPPAQPAYDYTCQGCGKRFRIPEGGVSTSCCVAHPPGSCCHYGETELNSFTSAPDDPVHPALPFGD